MTPPLSGFGRLTRRQLLAAAAGGGAATLLELLPPHLAEALAAPPCQGRLQDVEHVVILIQENRSFDHYFGTYPAIRGFSDPEVLRQADGRPVFEQPLPSGFDFGAPSGYLRPFHLDTQQGNAECTNDITHEWGRQHQSWNHGAMDRFAVAHLEDDPVNGPLCMGYYTRGDLPFYYALADAFTLCDQYFCSVIGPTDPNRLLSLTGTLDPDGWAGGPHLTTLVQTRPEKFGAYTWKTYPEQLQAAGVTWKVYSTPDGNVGDNVLSYFRTYLTDPALAANAFAPTFPGQFQIDCAANTLPQVSWVLAPLINTEHPPAPPEYGEWVVAQVLSALTANPEVWAHTVLFVTYDENGGFFDHVPPPTPPPGTPGEYLTVHPLPTDAAGYAGPVGLGFRVPLLVVSPFSRGGYVCHDVFDHTSLLRFLETRFGVPIPAYDPASRRPGLSPWRRHAVGDLTSTLQATADTSLPTLPATSLADPVVLRQCVPSAIASQLSNGKPSPLVPVYQVRNPAALPGQEPGARRLVGETSCGGTEQGGSGAALDSTISAAGEVSSLSALPSTGATSPSPLPGLVAPLLLGALAWIMRRRSQLGGSRRRGGEDVEAG